MSENAYTFMYLSHITQFTQKAQAKHFMIMFYVLYKVQGLCCIDLSLK